MSSAAGSSVAGSSAGASAAGSSAFVSGISCLLSTGLSSFASEGLLKSKGVIGVKIGF